MTAKSETAITNAIIAWVKENNGDAWHVHGGMYQRSGEPDICGEIQRYFNEVLDRRWIHIKWEVKTPTGKPSKLQILRLDRYIKRGYCSGIVTSIVECEDLLYEFVKYGNNRISWREMGYDSQIATMELSKQNRSTDN